MEGEPGLNPLLPSRRAEHLMGMPQAAQRWTPAMVRALPEDGNRYEVVAGELFVTPAPSFDHQQAVARLLLRLVPYVDAHGLGYALASPADIEFEEEHPRTARHLRRAASRGAPARAVVRHQTPAPGRRGPLARRRARRSNGEAATVPARRCPGLLDRGRRGSRSRVLAPKGTAAGSLECDPRLASKS